MAPQAGTLIADKIRLERVLGHGGMASVWVGEHLALHTRVAVKFMSSEIAQVPEARARFDREASAAARIRSPHVVQVFDHGVTADGVPYIVMELLEGEDLDQRIERMVRLGLSEVVPIVSQICKALARAHAQGIVHRDIKPENVFLVETDDGEPFVKLLDFGIAKQHFEGIDSLTTAGTSFGSPYYMSPEQIVSAKEVDHRSDLWSVGVVAYHALTGTRPFDGDTIAALALAIHSGPIEPPSRRCPELPPSVDAWMAKMFARDPNARFGSAKEVGEALRLAAERRWLPESASASLDVTRKIGPRSARAAAIATDMVAYGAATGPSTAGSPAVSPLNWILAALVVMAALAGLIMLFRTAREPAIEPVHPAAATSGVLPAIAPATGPSSASTGAPIATDSRDAADAEATPASTPKPAEPIKRGGHRKTSPGDREDYGF